MTLGKARLGKAPYLLFVGFLGLLGSKGWLPQEQIISAGAKREDPAPKEVLLSFKECHDGDTCKAVSGEGFNLTLRLVGVDAPEVAKKRGPKKKRHEGQIFGDKARDFLNSRVSGKQFKVKILGNDQYNRYLGLILDDKLRTGSKSINEELVEQGYAFAYTGRDSKDDVKQWALKAETTARDAKRGFWGLEQKPESPDEFRKKNR